MKENQAQYLLARINMLQVVTAQLAAVYQIAFEQPGTDLLASMHENVRDSLRTRMKVTGGNTDTDLLAMQATMLQELDQFFRQAKVFAEKD